MQNYAHDTHMSLSCLLPGGSPAAFGFDRWPTVRGPLSCSGCTSHSTRPAQAPPGRALVSGWSFVPKGPVSRPWVPPGKARALPIPGPGRVERGHFGVPSSGPFLPRGCGEVFCRPRKGRSRQRQHWRTGQRHAGGLCPRKAGGVRKVCSKKGGFAVMKERSAAAGRPGGRQAGAGPEAAVAANHGRTVPRAQGGKDSHPSALD